MADNFVRKTVQENSKIPNLSFYELGDILILNNNSFHYVANVNGRKTLINLVQAETLTPLTTRLTTLESKVKTLETTVADHEARIKALEATP